MGSLICKLNHNKAYITDYQRILIYKINHSMLSPYTEKEKK